MSNPLALFRKHQKILLVVFGVALMVVFTVGGIVSQWLGTSSPQTENEVVVKLKTDPAAKSVETLRESDMRNLRYSRLFLRQFMRHINALAAQRGATPQRSLGIPDTDGERSLLQTMILSQKAESIGVVVTDESIIRFLEQYTEGHLQRGEFANELYNISQGRMSQAQFFNAMRKEMLALRFMDLFQRGIYPSTPAASWDFYQRLNRQVQIEAVPFNATQFLDRVNAPSDAEIAKAYEEGRDRYAIPNSPEPGFKRRRTVALQYVRADLEPFLNEEKEKITDEAIEIFYNENIEQFRNIQLPDESEFNPAAPAADTPSTEGGDAGNAESSDPPSEETPANNDEDKDASTTVPVEPTTDDAPATALDTDELTDETVDTDDSGDDSGNCGPLQDDEEETEAADDDLAQRESDESAGDDESDTDSKNDTEDSAQADKGGETADSEDEVDVVTETTVEAATEEDEETDDALSDILGDTAPPTDAAKGPESDSADLGDLPDGPGTEAAQAEFKSLEEVSDLIRTELATALAVDRMEKAINAVRSEMRAYHGAYIVWDVSPDRDKTPQPTPPNLREIAAKHGLTVGDIPLVNVLEIQETDPITGEPRYPISQSFDQNFTPFAQLAFGEDLRLYEPRSIRGQLRDLTYLYWKTGATAEETPSLEQCREEVVRDLKMRAASKLAKQDAESTAERLRRNNQTPQDAYRNAPDRTVIEAGPFSWMTAPSVPYLPPQISPVTGIRYAGPEFMREVFKLQQGETGVAVDEPEKTAYVVYLKQEVSNLNQLRDAFFRTGFSYEIAQMGLAESREMLREWYTNYESKLDVDWEREPQPDSRQR